MLKVRNRIEKKFRELKRKNKKALIVFITAGYPNLSTTKKLIYEFSRLGVDIIELGVPFSDPIADGAIIQEASQYALRKNKTSLSDILRLVKDVRKNLDVPIALMSYYNPVFCFKESRFIAWARACGVDGIIIPDLPVEEGVNFSKHAGLAGLDVIFFLAPTSEPRRIKYISKISRGFIYYISLTGVTGAKKNLSRDLIQKLKMIKRHTHKPVCVGFGISQAGQIRQINKIADGTIVGSAVIKKIKDNIHKNNLVDIVGRFVASLKNV